MGENTTILAVDDQKENLDLLLEILQDYEVMPALNGKKALEIVKSESIALILLDIVMPTMSGLELCKILKSEDDTKEIPVIFITAKTDEASIAQAYGAGALDYVSKPLKRAEVIARVETQLRLSRTIKELEFLASRDSMTGIYNRRKFFELSKPIFEHQENDLFLAMLDIDLFKSINDTYGHDVGDIVIKATAKTVAQLLPKDALFARIGGEEFVAMFRTPRGEDAYKILETVRAAIATLKIPSESGIRFTVSIGLVQKNGEIKNIDAFIKQADIALYEAKQEGRNKTVFR